MTIGSEILASNYVAIQDKAQSILGSGIGSRGYGQLVGSSDVFTGNIITKEQWDLLRYDIVNIRVHQDGLPPSIITINVGDPIGYGAASPNTNYDALLDTAIANRFNVASNQSIVSAGPIRSYSSAWSTSAQSTLTATFSTADEARYFFNSGGKIRITSGLAGSSNTSQNNAWVSFLNTAGTRSFGAATNQFVNFYTLTNSYQIYYQESLTTPYSANNYKLEASCNVANNSAGTATEVYLRVTLSDAYVDPDTLSFANNQPPGDSVDGTLTISVEELKASGNLVPSGTFTITSPTYSLSAISAS